jgi:hypothetical protein
MDRKDGAGPQDRRRRPYEGLRYPELREAHDRIYFGAWRGSSPTLLHLEEAYRQLGNFLDALQQTLDPGSPKRAQEHLAKARETHRRANPETTTDSTVFTAINNTLSYGHRALDILLQEKGQPNHVTRDFAQYYDLTQDEDGG